VTLAIIFAFLPALAVIAWLGWTLNCLGFHDWDTARDFTDYCRRCGAKRFK
jgi:hypothetical protein